MYQDSFTISKGSISSCHFHNHDKVNFIMKRTASKDPSTQQTTGQKTRQDHWKHCMILWRWVRGGHTLPAGSGLDMVMEAWGQDKVADWGEEQHWSWQSFHATVQLIPSHFVPQSHRLLPPRQISHVLFPVCFPALFFLLISICALLKLLLERAGVFRSVMETAENVILPPLLAGHVVDDNLGGARGWCGNEGSRKEHKEPKSFIRVKLWKQAHLSSSWRM